MILRTKYLIFIILIFAVSSFSYGQEIRVRSIREWTTCDGITDDSVGFAKAINLAKNKSFILQVDCPVYIKIGMDISKPIFIDNGSDIRFNGDGLIIVDNILLPAFVIVNSSHINLTNWQIKYRGGLPISDITGGYYQHNKFVTQSGRTPSAHAFNNITLKNWLIENKDIIFANGFSSFWTGPLDSSAIFYIKGNSSDINISNMFISSESLTSPSHYVPIVFSLLPGEVEHSIVKRCDTIGKPAFNVPHNIIFDNIHLDGYYFGWHGSGQNLTIKNVKAFHYSDLQDDLGNNIGGIGIWFPPPHLIYLNSQSNFSNNLLNNNIHINNVVDYGQRLGLARDKGGKQQISGNVLSLKIQANNSIINKYTSLRLDGFLDILSSVNLVVKDIVAKYDSSFINYTLPIIRFTQFNNHNITFENLSLYDTAKFTYINPIIGYNNKTNTNIKFKNVVINLNNWSGANKLDYKTSGIKINEKTSDEVNKESEVLSYIKVEMFDTTKFNNTLRNIPIGSFGLRALLVRNTSSSEICSLSFPSLMSRNFSYDLSRSTCVIDNSYNLLKNQSCIVVFKYRPTKIDIESVFSFRITAIDKLKHKIISNTVYLPYSSR